VADSINLRGLRALGRHGLAPGEKDQAQPFEIDLDLELDLGAAVAADDLDLTVNYGPLSTAIVELVETNSFDLIEVLAERIAALVREDRRVDRVTVSLRKLRPPVAAHLESAGVTITR
jgi:7,8-dihydroneopterin aldolase/epimerase/oxygenase